MIINKVTPMVEIINLPRTSDVFSDEGIPIIEARFDAKYIGEFPFKNDNGSFVNRPVALFWVENPDVAKGHSNYIAFATSNGKLLVTNGISATGRPIAAIRIKDTGEIIYSRYRHDCVRSSCGRFTIDGGADYCIINGDTDLFDSVTLGIDGGIVYVTEE